MIVEKGSGRVEPGRTDDAVAAKPPAKGRDPAPAHPGNAGTKGQKLLRLFGFSENCLLIVLLRGDGRKLARTGRVPLNVKRAAVKKAPFPGQYGTALDFQEGEPFRIRAAGQARGVEGQKQNEEGFINVVCRRAR